MSNFSCNLISKDLLELQKTYSYEEYNGISAVCVQLLKDYDSEIELDEENLEEDLDYLSAFLFVLYEEINELCEKLHYGLSTIRPTISIKKKENFVLVVLRVFLYDLDYQLVFPKKEKLTTENIIVDEKKLNYYINKILLANDFYEYEDTDQLIDNCLVYIDFYGKEIEVREINKMYRYQNKGLAYKIGGYLEFKNTMMNDRLEYFKITKIKRRKVLELNDDIVKKLHFLNTKTVDGFKKKLKAVVSKIDSFDRSCMHFLEELNLCNDIHISKDFMEEFEETKLLTFPELPKSKEARYLMAKQILIDAYFEKIYYNMYDKYDYSYLNPFLREEYAFYQLVKSNDYGLDLNDYFEGRKYDSFIYTIIKNGGL